jgi:protein SCO1/2
LECDSRPGQRFSKGDEENKDMKSGISKLSSALRNRSRAARSAPAGLPIESLRIGPLATRDVVERAGGRVKRLRGHFIGAITLTIVAIAGASASAGGIDGAADEHMHHSMAPVASTNRTTVAYAVPDVSLVRQDGTQVKLREELNDGRPVVLAFIFTSCTTVCPLTSHTLSELQTKLGSERDRVHLVSITIDPEQDTPARLRAYAKTFNAGPEWQYYTGTREASEAAQRAFDVYRGAKMDHSPATLVRTSPGAPWVRIGGFATADQLYAELPNLATLHAAR